jgi:hypothetical protein
MLDLVKRAERFARERHHGQFRKGAAMEPYTIHLKEVAALVEKWNGSEAAIATAWLHDTVEDCPPTSITDLNQLFGAKIANFVSELTDNKSLPKEERKRLQIENASKKSVQASLVKLADKTSNVGALSTSPPSDWSLRRRLEYIAWAKSVVSHLPNLPVKGLNEFERRCEQAELQAYIDLGTTRQAQNAALRVIERRAGRMGATQEQSDNLLKHLMESTLIKE